MHYCNMLLMMQDVKKITTTDIRQKEIGKNKQNQKNQTCILVLRPLSYQQTLGVSPVFLGEGLAGTLPLGAWGSSSAALL